jgi:hypothetical protein
MWGSLPLAAHVEFCGDLGPFGAADGRKFWSDPHWQCVADNVSPAMYGRLCMASIDLHFR